MRVGMLCDCMLWEVLIGSHDCAICSQLPETMQSHMLVRMYDNTCMNCLLWMVNVYKCEWL